MAFSLPELPYARNALAPLISEQTFDFHYGKHHQAYVTNLNKLLEGHDWADAPLEKVIKASALDASKTGIFNNSAQVWNHTFFWHSMTPGGGGKPDGDVAALIDRDFGSYDGFRSAFAQAGATQFGSGWAWLVIKGGKLELRKTPNAETPLTEPGATALLTLDVWEHAYYLDFQNRRPDFISAFLDNLVNWRFANDNLAKAA
ncbi:MAG TPA: superoxide dismutase [Fe] [Hyphomonadaceae bacterium]|nr:superoxide dismutase [Fe] [Hyphomonadaceae bacterium]